MFETSVNTLTHFQRSHVRVSLSFELSKANTYTRMHTDTYTSIRFASVVVAYSGDLVIHFCDWEREPEWEIALLFSVQNILHIEHSI